MVVRVIVVLNRTVVDSDRRFDNLCRGHLQSQNELVIDRIGQLSRDFFGCLSLKP